MATATETPEITYGEHVEVGTHNVPAQLITVLGEPFVKFGAGIYSICGNCDGGFSGRKLHYLSIHDGICFQCSGSGVRSKVGADVQDAVRRAKRRISDRARRARASEAEADAAAEAARTWRAANADLADMLDAINAEYAEADHFAANLATTMDEINAARDHVDAKWGDFIHSKANQVLNLERPLTDQQTAAVVDAIAKALDAQAAEQARQDAQRYYGTEGDKIVATGTVAVSMSVEVRASYSYTGVATKRLVIIEGTGEFEGVTFKVFGTGKTLWDTERGQDVDVRGAVKEHSEYDGTKQTVLTGAKVMAR
ncbi:hypothetical protein ACFV9C_42460 [Kribbella sp. NPDC059898]|uniref:hypothetical protein n=1 Tax=Kribbella sp. NPDC059898 TaxID=3346995 RepID=UPI003658E8F7